MVRSQSVASTAASVGDNKINFFIYYEVDGDTSKHHLSASNYGPENECGCSSARLSDHLRWRVIQPFLRGSGTSMPVFLTDFG